MTSTTPEVYIVITLRDGAVMDTEVLDAMPTWDWRALGQIVRVGYLNGGDSSVVPMPYANLLDPDSDARRCEAVATALGKLGIVATAEHTGGGIYCVLIDWVTGTWFFGLANETWGGTLFDRESNDDIANVETPVPSDSRDVEEIAKAIEHALIAESARLVESLR